MNSYLKKLKQLTIVLITCAMIWAVGFSFFAFKATSELPYDRSQKSDAIIVLTGGDGRINEGLNLFAAKRAPYLFITSVFKLINENAVRQRWKGNSLLPDCCIILDYSADSTAQNALAVRKWINDNNAHAPNSSDLVKPIKTIRLVTSNYHLPRALLDFHRLLPDLIIYQHPIVSPNAGKFDAKYWTLLISEYNKYIFRYIQTYFPQSLQEAVA